MTALDESFVTEIKDLGGIVATLLGRYDDTPCSVCDGGRGALFHVMFNISHDRIPLDERSGAFTCSKDCTRTFVIEGRLKFG